MVGEGGGEVVLLAVLLVLVVTLYSAHVVQYRQCARPSRLPRKCKGAIDRSIDRDRSR